MKTPYLDDAIKRHEEALKINMLSDGGIEALNEFKAIKQALRIHDVVGRSGQLKALLSKVVYEFDSGEVTWDTRDEIESVLKSL